MIFPFSFLKPSAPPLAIVSVTPSRGKAGALIEVEGTGFRTGAVVKVTDGSFVFAPLTDVVVESSTKITGKIPAGVTPGMYGISVQQGDDFVFFGDAFEYIAPPVLRSVAADIVDAAGGDVLIAAVDNLGEDEGASATATVGGVPAAVFDWDGDNVMFTVPPLPPGMHDVIVTNVNGTSNALTIEARDKVVQLSGSGGTDAYYGSVASGAVSTARASFVLNAALPKTFTIIAGTNRGDGLDGWLVCVDDTVSGVTAAVGQLTVYVGTGGSLKRVARKFLTDSDIGRLLRVHIVANGTDVRAYLDGRLLDVPLASNGITASTSRMLIGGRLDGTYRTPLLTVYDVAEGAVPITASQVALDAASPIPAFPGQTHRYVASSSVGATWNDEVGTAHLSLSSGSASIISARAQRVRHRGVLEIWGDSIAAGRQSGGGLGNGWRRAMQQELSGRGIAVSLRGFTYSNAGTNDYDMWHSATGGEALVSRLSTLASLLPQTAPSDAATLLAYGINDIVALNRTAAQLQEDIRTAVGIIASERSGPIFVCNMLPYNGLTAGQRVQWEAFQADFNTTFIPGLQATYPQVVGIDYAGVVTNPADPTQLYDGVHPAPPIYTEMGAGRIAPAVDRAMRPLVLVDHNVADIAGGDELIVSSVDGFDLEDVSVTWGDAAVAVAERSRTSAKLTLPPRSAGTHPLVLTKSSGRKHVIPIKAFSWSSPSSVTLKHLWMPYMGGVTLAGSKVAQVNDLVGNMHQVQETDAARPSLVASDPAYGGKPTIAHNDHRFYVLNQQTPKIASPVSALIFGHTATGRSLCGTTEASAYNMIWNFGGAETQFYGVSGGTNTAGSGGALGKPGMTLVTRDTSGTNPCQIYSNDLSLAKGSGPGAWTACADYCLGYGNAGIPNCIGSIAGGAIYSGVPSARDRADLEKFGRLKFLRPALLTMSTDIVDTFGGDVVTCTGYHLEGASVRIISVATGSVSRAVVTASSFGSISFRMPPLLGGDYLVQVVGVFGALTNTKPLEAFGFESTSVPVRHILMPYRGGLTMVASKVSRIADAKGGLHQVQTDDVKRPTLTAADAAYGGKPTLNCNVSSFDAEANVATINTPVSVLVIGHATSSTCSLLGYVAAPGTNPDPQNMVWNTGTNQAEFFNRPTVGGAAFRTTGPADNKLRSPGALLVTDDGVTNALYQNSFAAPAASAASHWTPAVNLRIGKGVAGVSDLIGSIAGMVVWGGVPNASDRTKLARLIRFKFGLAAVTW